MASVPTEPLGYTMEEAATRLRIGRRSLQELVKKYPFYYANGHRKLFTEDDIHALIQAMRPRVDRLIANGRSGVGRSSQSSGRISPETLAKAKLLFAKKSR